MMKFPIVRLALGAAAMGSIRHSSKTENAPWYRCDTRGRFAVLLLLQSVQNLNRFTMRSHRRVKKLPSWVVVSTTAVFSAAATVSPVL